MHSQLFSKVRTLEERDMLKEEISLLTDALYKQKGQGFESSLKSQVRLWVSEIIKTEVPNNFQEIEKYLKSVEESLGKMKVLKLTLAFEPTDLTVDKIFQFAYENIGEGTVLDFDYDPTILGGALITWNGQFKDFSLKKLFEEEYKAQEAEVMKIMYSK